MRSVTGHLCQVGDAIAAAFTQESKSLRFYACSKIERLNPGFSAGVCQRLR
ncbi:MAG: hypothetical protein VKN72_07245 [Nostocales cyanobacterium 94392]|nr:hypothetical protein [Nostocales cyanobacterium 94392]